MTIDPLIHELRLAWRGLRRARRFSAAAIVTLAVGMAGATSMFAIVQGVLLRPLPLHEPDRLVVVSKALPGADASHWPFHATEVELFRGIDAVFDGVAAVGYNEPSETALVDGSLSETIRTARVSGGFFDILGIHAFAGRMLTPADDGPGAEAVLVLAHDAWQRRYGGAAGAIGTRLTIGEQRFTIVGVLPPGIDIPRGVEAWMTIEARARTTKNPTFQGAIRNELDVVARLRPDVTVADAARRLETVAGQLDALVPVDAATRGGRPVIRLLADVIVGDVRGGLVVLFAAVGLVLLIACANVANLLLVRGEQRRHQFALRVALGASRWRLIGQIATESLLLSAAAGIIGLAIAYGTLPLLLSLAPGGVPRVDAVRIDGSVVSFAFLLSLLATVAAGLVPALASTRLSRVSDAQRSGRLLGSGSKRGRRLLVAAQVALAVTVVAAAGLVGRSLLRLQATGAALGADQLSLVSLALPQERYADRARLLSFLEDLTARLAATPLIAAATPINATPFSGVGWDVPTFVAEGQDATAAAANGSLTLEAVHSQYFATFGLRLVRGRAFERTDGQDAPLVAIVSAEVAARLWPGEDPIGKRLKMGTADSADTWRRVVGVADNTRYRELQASHPTLYVPAAQLIVTAQSLVVRSPAPAAQVTALVRDQVNAIDPAVRITRVAPFTDLLQGPLARPRFYSFVLAVFGVSALLLAAVGLYAVVAASMRQRHRELGVRLAFGATPAQVHALVLREGVGLAAIGAVVGLAMTTVTTEWLRGLLYEVQPLDPATMTAAAGLVLGGAALAAYLPARSAARMNPLAALRDE